MKNKIKKIIQKANDIVEFSAQKKQKIYHVELFQNDEFRHQKHIYFLSTGRCGTMYFANLLDQFKTVKSYHEPLPTLARQAKIAWDYQNQNDANDFLKTIFITAREWQMHRVFEHGFRYAETNNMLTFFAPILCELFPNAKFVHIVRHPGEFVRSAIRRKFYSGEHHYDLFRIQPLEMDENFQKWSGFSQIQKNAWLWNATNQFIENFGKLMQNDRFFQFNFNERSEQTTREMFDFLELRGNVSVHLKKRMNAQKSGDFPKFSNWTETQKTELREICGVLAEEYGYDFN